MISVRGKGISVKQNHFSFCIFYEDEERCFVFLYVLPFFLSFLKIDYDVWAAKHFSLLGTEAGLCWVGVDEVHLQQFEAKITTVNCYPWLGCVKTSHKSWENRRVPACSPRKNTLKYENTLVFNRSNQWIGICTIVSVIKGHQLRTKTLTDFNLLTLAQRSHPWSPTYLTRLHQWKEANGDVRNRRTHRKSMVQPKSSKFKPLWEKNKLFERREKVE